MPLPSAAQALKKRYSERLSRELAEEVAAGLRRVGFVGTKPLRGGPSEKEFQGGLGPKKVDVSFADDRRGLLLAVSVKSICFPPYGKNLKNRFGDLCTEAITLHMRFPYSVVCALFAMPEAADQDRTRLRVISTFRRASMLLGTISGREEYTDAGEKFEDVTMVLFSPIAASGPGAVSNGAGARLFVASPNPNSSIEISEEEYFARLRDHYNLRNPHAQVGIDQLKLEDEDIP